jgi:hypothetical protein
VHRGGIARGKSGVECVCDEGEEDQAEQVRVDVERLVVRVEEAEEGFGVRVGEGPVAGQDVGDVLLPWGGCLGGGARVCDGASWRIQ